MLFTSRSSAQSASATTAAVRNDDALIGLRKVMDYFAGQIVIDNRAHRDLQYFDLAIASAAVGTFAVTSAIAFVFRVKAEVDQRVMPLAGLHNNIAAMAAVAARGTTARDKLLPAEGHASVAAVSGFDLDDCFVDEHLLVI